MWIFRKPKPKYNFTTILIPIIATIILGMSAYIVKGMDSEIKEKASNESGQAAINALRHDSEQRDKRSEQRDNRIEFLYEKVLELKQNSQQIAPTVSSEEQPKTKAKQKSEIHLSPEEFTMYMKMEPDIRIKYKKYLESIGKDVSNLP